MQRRSQLLCIYAKEDADGSAPFAYMKDCITYDLILQAGRGDFQLQSVII